MFLAPFTSMKRTLPLLIVGLVALVAVLAVGLSQRPKDASDEVAPLTLAEQQKALAGAPSQLAGLHVQASELLGGGRSAFEARLAALRGYPVVVNKWGSWCGPCRAEFPLFQHAAASAGRRVAFLGVNASDNDAAARRFLRSRPVSYPSYRDPRLRVSTLLSGFSGAPVTAFYDSRGRKVFSHAGQYASLADLEADIKRYAR